MNLGLLAIVGLGFIGLIALGSKKPSAINQYEKITTSDDLSWMDKDTDLLTISNELLEQGLIKESAEIREMHAKIYGPHMTAEDIENQINNWKQNITDLYGVTWQ